MKTCNKKSEKSPYATLGLEKINAPAGKKGHQPKATKTVSETDIRARKEM